QGYWLRERAGGGWRGTWHSDLVPREATRAVLSWKIDLSKRPGELQRLAAALAQLAVPVARYDTPDGGEADLAAMLRDHGGEVRRRHAVDEAIAEDPERSAGELVEELDRRGLLEP